MLWWAATLCAQNDVFEGAQWIAMEADSTILFPHIHLLKKSSEKGQSLKQYALPVFERQVPLRQSPIKRAQASVCGLGQYELFINGQRVGQHFLDPGWTMYNKELLYNTFDVTPHLSTNVSHPSTNVSQPSTNVSQLSTLNSQLSSLNSQPSTLNSKLSITVMLGGGMYDIPLQGYHKFAGSCGAPKLLFALHIDYEDGQRQTIVSDASWTVSESPVRYSSIFGGETYDATFTSPKKPVVITRPHWSAPLKLQDDRTRLRIKAELPMAGGRMPRIFAGPPTESPTSRPLIFDSRQNCSGIVRLTVRGKRGATVTLRPAELLKDGHAYQRCAPKYAWTYTLSGNAEGETWQPQFSYTGFRYIEVEADDEVEILDLTALHTSADVMEAGHFECSDTLLNNIYTLIDWAISSNLASITTDCPTREKLGWQEQNHLMAASMMYRYDMRALMNKIADDMAVSQHDDGAIPTIAPEYTDFGKGSGFEDTPEWGASFILCPWYTYLWYGDDSALRRHYDAMKRYIDYLQRRTVDNILDYGLGDWYDIGPERPGKAQLTSVALSATAMYHYDLLTMTHIAQLLGRDDDAQRFTAMAADVKRAFNQRFWNSEKRQYENGSQTASAMALYMNLVTDDNRDAVQQSLVNDISSRMSNLPPLNPHPSTNVSQLSTNVSQLSTNVSQLSTLNSQQPPLNSQLPPLITAGDVGFRYVLQALQQGGCSQLIWQVSQRDDIPGYAWQLRQGATALTESWQAYDNVSNNHLMLGHLMEWLFQAPGGIRQAEGSVAWRHIVIEPQMVGSLTWANASLRSPQGLIACHWTATPDRSHWTVDVTIPQGAEADIYLPDGSVQHVEAGQHQYHS